MFLKKKKYCVLVGPFQTSGYHINTVFCYIVHFQNERTSHEVVSDVVGFSFWGLNCFKAENYMSDKQ